MSVPGRALARAGAVALLLVVGGVVLRQLGPGVLRTVPPTGEGALAFAAAGAALTAAGLPRQVVAFAGGYVFGPVAGSVLSLLGQMVGCVVDYGAARFVAGDWARRTIARRPRVAFVHDTLAAHPFTSTLTLRLLPVGNNLVLNLIAGVAAVRAVPFLLATLIGYVPQTVIFALLGSGVQLGRGTQLGIGAALFVASGALGYALYIRRR
jgi:uncharacterized membrane protein YdjX (TVP38/TMEM64 family)